MSLDGTFIFNRRATFLKGLALFVGGLAGCVVCVFLAGRAVVAPGFVVAWGAYLMLRAAKAGRNLGEIELAPCAVCMRPIASVMVGQFCAKCSKPIHNECLGAHVQTH
jgi:chromate transport protein ChrA